MNEHPLEIVKKLRTKFRYGLFWYFLLSRLKSLGIEISLYYWVQEGLPEKETPNVGDLIEGCSFELLGPKDMPASGSITGREWCPEEKLLARLEKGNLCLGAKYQDKIAACTWCDFAGDNFTDQKITIQPNEADLFDMHALKPFRGYNIAPHLHYQCYKMLKEMGRNICYSVSDFFNTPSIKFKKKLNATFLELRLDVKLCKIFHGNWKIKEYAKG